MWMGMIPCCAIVALVVVTTRKEKE